MVEDGILHIYAEAGNPGPHTTSAYPHVGAVVTGGISATTMTVDSLTGFIPIGAYVSTNLDNVGQVVSQSSGSSGGAGTYIIENPNGVSVAAHTSNGININGGPYGSDANSASTGGLSEQFVDYYTCPIDSAAASRAAPFGVRASCTNNTVTLTWMSTTLGSGAESQAYNVYRGTSGPPSTIPGTQTTLVGSTSSNTINDTPGGGQWWYKVVKVSGGVEYLTKCRIVSVYVG